MKELRLFGSSFLIYVILSVLIGLLPAIKESEIPAGPGVQPLTLHARAGRDVFVSEGCAYCHTQQVRPLAEDKEFGRPSAPGDFAYQTPELLGSERTGPDLTDIGVRQPSQTWQLIHLYNPRAVVRDSVMPSYWWYFRLVDKAQLGEVVVPVPAQYVPAHKTVVATQQALDTVAYLLSLKQPPLPGYAPPVQMSAVAPAAPSAGFNYATLGGQVYGSRCAACHQATGAGLSGAFPPLAGDPIVTLPDARQHLRIVLFGLQGKAIGGKTFSSQMPAFAGQLSDAEIASVIDYERTSWGNHARTISPQDVARARKGK